MAKKVKKLKNQDQIDKLDVRIKKFNAKTTKLKKGNKNDKIVAKLLADKVKKTLVKQKEQLEIEK